jgi:hypothetical protein
MKVPASHAMQVVEAFAPSASDALPGPHGVHELTLDAPG